jgi:hypothetical protein
MRWVGEVFDGLRVTGQDREPAFPDGAAFRIEIPGVEGPRVLEAVLRAAEAEGITVNRVSQGTGAMLLRASELRDMAQAGLDAGIEVCLSVGPRERYGTGAHARSADGKAHGDQVRGLRQMSYALEDVLRATEEGSAVSWSPTRVAPGGDAGAGPGRAADHRPLVGSQVSRSS